MDTGGVTQASSTGLETVKYNNSMAGYCSGTLQIFLFISKGPNRAEDSKSEVSDHLLFNYFKTEFPYLKAVSNTNVHCSENSYNGDLFTG